MTRRLLERLPIFACAGFFGFLFLANIWNFAVERDWPKLRIRSAERPLAGHMPYQSATWTLEGFLDGVPQHTVSTNFGSLLPVFNLAVRSKNQTLYSIFGISGSGNIIVGRNRQLLEKGYVDEYCARGAPPDSASLKRWADSIAEIATVAQTRGKGFVYLVSPSKVAHAPQYLPAGLACPALARGLTQDKLTPFRAALEQRGAPYLDSTQLLGAEKGNYPIDLFSRGGVHWNLLGAALTLRDMTRIFDSAPGGSPVGRLNFDWREDDVAKGTDRDLLDLLNLYWPDDHYPTAVVEGRGKGVACPRAPRILMVGDSFMRQLIVVSAQTPCPPTIDHWFYMRDDRGDIALARFVTKPGEIGIGVRLPNDLAQLPQSFLQADAIVLEENESNIGETKQVGNLLEAIRTAK